MPNYIQPDYRVPTIQVSVQVEGKANPLITGPAPPPIYVENLSDKDDPQRIIRGPKGLYRP
jgi:hypothetical protein